MTPLTGAPDINQERFLELWSKADTLRYDILHPETFKSPFKLSSDPPRLFALLIGINEYHNAPHLSGAAADAVAFKVYLESHLGVPTENIVTLLNWNAARSEIIRELHNLRDNKRIQKGDPILVFFSGYGGEVAYTEGSAERRVEEFIVPQDYSEAPGHQQPAISTLTISSIVYDIAKTKGNNITVIYDCSHSTANVPIAINAAGLRIRSLRLLPSLHPIDLDSNIRVNASKSNATYIKACTSPEFAFETHKGNFTKALLRLLRNHNPHEMQYCDIPTNIDQLPGQTPRVEGPSSQKTLFDGKVLVTQRACFHLDFDSEKYVLHAGTIHGITTGAEFAVFATSDTSFLCPLGTLRVASLGGFSSVLSLPPGAPQFSVQGEHYFALQTKMGEREDIRLFFSADERLVPAYEALISIMQSPQSGTQHISLVSDPKDAHIEIAMEGEKAVFLIRDQQVTQYGLTRMPYEIVPTVEEIFAVIRAAAMFYWKLNRTNDNPDISTKVDIEFYLLDSHPDDIFAELSPVGENMCRNGIVEFVIKPECPYGLRLVNNGPYDLYPYLFYFDSSDLSIGAYYQPLKNRMNSADPPLQKNGGTMSVGYGEEGGNPVSYYLRDNQTVDFGFLKIFLSTTPVDLSSITQSTPFEASRSVSSSSKPPVHTWSTVILPIVQHRGGPPIEAPPPNYDSLSNMKDIYVEENTYLKEELVIQKSRAELQRLQLEEKCNSLSAELEGITRLIKENKEVQRPQNSKKLQKGASLKHYARALSLIIRQILDRMQHWSSKT